MGLVMVMPFGCDRLVFVARGDLRLGVTCVGVVWWCLGRATCVCLWVSGSSEYLMFGDTVAMLLSGRVLVAFEMHGGRCWCAWERVRSRVVMVVAGTKVMRLIGVWYRMVLY